MMSAGLTIKDKTRVNVGSECKFGCVGDDVALHYGWFHCTPKSRALLAQERAKLAADELVPPEGDSM